MATATPLTPTNPLDFPRYIRSIRPSLPESLPSYVDDELNKLSQALTTLEEASSNDAKAKVSEERIVRVTADEALAARIVTVDAKFTAKDTTTNARISTEEISRARADEATASRVDTVEATLTSSLAKTDAAVTSETLSRVTKDGALASKIDGVAALYSAADLLTNARVTTETIARTTADLALASTITTVRTDFTTADATLTASIVSEATARSTKDTALATDITTVTATAAGKNKTFSQGTAPTASAIGDIWFDTSNNSKTYRWSGSAWVASDDGRIASNTAAITTEATARASGDSANASDITTVSTTVSGHTSTLSTQATSISGLQAKYGVKLDVNGYVSGFEQNNGGGTSDFIVRADTFKVISVGNPSIVPFTVTGLGVQINGNLVVSGTISSTQIAPSAVDTSKILNNAVTIPVSAYTASAISSTAATYVTAQTLTLTSTGAPILVSFSVNIPVFGTSSVDNNVRILRNGTEIYMAQLPFYASSTTTSGGLFSASLTDIPGAIS
jgi:hypothetical protein